MAALPQTPEELLDVVRSPLDLFKRVGIDIDIETTVSNISDKIPTDTSGVFPWLQNFWEQARGILESGDVFGGIWTIIKTLLEVAVGLLAALVDLLRSLVS